MRGREVKIKVWTYSEGDEFPIRRSSFLRRHWKAFLIAFLAIILAATAWSSIAASSASQPSFTPDSPYVYDGADVLDSSIADTLTQLNETLESQAEGAQLYVVTIDSLPLGQTIEDYSIEQAQRIGAGDSEKDNGVLYTFVKSTRQDRLEVGYGLEDRLTDSVCSKILDSAHGYYRDGDIKAGVKDLARDVANVIQPGIDGGTPFVPPVRHEFPEKEESILSKIAIGVLALLYFAFYVARAYYRDDLTPSSAYRSHTSSSQYSHSSSSHRSSHQSGSGRFGGGGASGGW